MNTFSYEAGSLFLEGPTGVGKTTAVAGYIQSLVAQGLDPQTVLVLVPHRQARLFRLFNEHERPHIYTYPALVHLLIEQFWPLIVHQLGSAVPAEPRFLSLEGSYYYLDQLLDTVGAELLATLRLPRIRIVQQLWNLINQATHAGLTLQQAHKRLEYSLEGRGYYQAAFAVAHAYRAFCHQNGLVDLAEQAELFTTVLLDADAFQSYFHQVITCVVADNIEEMTGVAHDFLFWCMENTDSSVLVSDWDAGFRTVLGADAGNAAQLGLLCHRRITWRESPDRPPALGHLDFQLQSLLTVPEQTPPLITVDLSSAIHLETSSLYQGMIESVVERVQELCLEKHIPPNQIVMVVPYLGDALRLALVSRLENLNISHYEYRPSRALAEEPWIQAILTLMRVWAGEIVTSLDMAMMFTQLLPGTDPIRASLLSKAAYIKGEWIPFTNLSEGMRKRIWSEIGSAYEALRLWLASQTVEAPHEFLAAFVHEFHLNSTNVDLLGYLQERIESFFNTVPAQPSLGRLSLVSECVRLVQKGFIAAHASYNAVSAEKAVLISPAHTFLSLDKSVNYQFWIDVSNTGWSERMNQVLSNPYVLRRSFPPGAIWTEELEAASEHELLRSLSLGLLRRCGTKVYAFASTTSLSGAEQRGPLLNALQQLLTPAYE
jgi:hypothetical protein